MYVDVYKISFWWNKVLNKQTTFIITARFIDHKSVWHISKPASTDYEENQ